MTIIFTDGASRGNPGPGGWAAVVIEGEGTAATITEAGGFEADTTNNRMEISAAVGGLSKTHKDAHVLVYTDSSYLINGITKWIHGWKRNGWMTKAQDEVLNRDLWEKLHDLTSTRRVEWKYVGGHVGILGNERCDHIATAFADERDDVTLFKGKLADSTFAAAYSPWTVGYMDGLAAVKTLGKKRIFFLARSDSFG